MGIDGEEKATGEVCAGWLRKMTVVAFARRSADYQNHAIGWLHRGYSSLGGGKAVRFPRIWMVYGECRLRETEIHRRRTNDPWQFGRAQAGLEDCAASMMRTILDWWLQLKTIMRVLTMGY